MRSTLAICLLLGLSAPLTASAIGIPLALVEGEWTPTRLRGIEVGAMRMELAPSMDDERDQLVWLLDTTFVVRNTSTDPQTLTIGIPNAWSIEDFSVRSNLEDFWGEAFINGAEVGTEVVRLVANPAHQEVAYRAVRPFEVRLDGNDSAHVRLRYALPSSTSEHDEQQVVVPMHLRKLWNTPIEFGLVSLSWTDRMFSFRTNLSSFALYGNRVEWFVQGFEPETDLEVRFLSRRAVLLMVSRRMGCPMPWEVMDRVTEGRPDLLEETLQTVPTDVLEMCAALPAMLRGSQGALRHMGLNDPTIQDFAPEGSDLRGPLFIHDPTYRADRLNQSEGIYVRFLTGEVERRRSD